MDIPHILCIADNTRRAMETVKWNDKHPDSATIADIRATKDQWQAHRHSLLFCFLPASKQTHIIVVIIIVIIVRIHIIQQKEDG